MPAGPAPTTRMSFFAAAGSTAPSSPSTSGFTVHEIGLPNMMPLRQRKQPMQGRISEVLPSAAFLANWASQTFARPIMQASA